MFKIFFSPPPLFLSKFLDAMRTSRKIVFKKYANAVVNALLVLLIMYPCRNRSIHSNMPHALRTLRTIRKQIKPCHVALYSKLIMMRWSASSATCRRHAKRTVFLSTKRTLSELFFLFFFIRGSNTPYLAVCYDWFEIVRLISFRQIGMCLEVSAFLVYSNAGELCVFRFRVPCGTFCVFE